MNPYTQVGLKLLYFNYLFVFASWFQSSKNSPFTHAKIIHLWNISAPASRMPAISIREHALDLNAGGFIKLPTIKSRLDVFNQPALEAFAALICLVRRQVRKYLQKVFRADIQFPISQDNVDIKRTALVILAESKNRITMQIGDCTISMPA